MVVHRDLGILEDRHQLLLIDDFCRRFFAVIFELHAVRSRYAGRLDSGVDGWLLGDGVMRLTSRHRLLLLRRAVNARRPEWR